MQSESNKSTIVMVSAIISASGAIIAALIGLGGPVIEALVQKQTPPPAIHSAASLPFTLEPSSASTMELAASVPATHPSETEPTSATPTLTAPASPEASPIITALTYTPPPAATSTHTPTATVTSTPPARLEEYTHAAGIGAGIFADAYYTDGNEPVKKNKINSLYPDIQWIDRSSTVGGCTKAKYTADLIWFNAGGPTQLTLKGSPVGEVFAATGKHGYILNLVIDENAELCVSPIPDAGFRIVLGPDMLFHYESFCYRGYCK